MKRSIQNLVILLLSTFVCAGAWANQGNRLTTGQYLSADQYLVSANQQYFAIMQSDGNFVVYRGTGPADNQGFIWATNTPTSDGPSFAAMQADGNFTINRGSHPGAFRYNVWASGTASTVPDVSPYLQLTNGGTLSIVANSCQYYQNSPLRTYTTSNCIAVSDAPYHENLALNKPTWQSSTGYGGLSARAIDGNTNGSWGNASVSHTGLSAEPWWKVDLQGLFNITEVILYNRTDCCADRLADLHVDLLDENGQVVASKRYEDAVEGDVTIRFPGYKARYVRVQLNGANFLSLAEVIVRSDVATSAHKDSLATDKISFQAVEGFGGVASRAVDGNLSGNWANGSVTATMEMDNPLWGVWLEGPRDITEVTLFNRTDCCPERLSNFTVTLQNEGNVVATQTFSGTVGEQLTLRFPRTEATHVLVQLNGPQKILSLAEVIVRENLALGKPRDQSATDYGGDASRAVDGNVNGAWSGSSVTHTANVAQAWWHVDLEQQENIGEVIIWNRTDCCSERLSNYVVELLNDAGDVVSAIPVSSTSVKTIVDFEGTLGRFVQVRLKGSNYLSLAEVEVFEHYSRYGELSWDGSIEAEGVDHAQLADQLLDDGHSIKLQTDTVHFVSCHANALVETNASSHSACEFTVQEVDDDFILKTPHGYLAPNGSGNFVSNGSYEMASRFTAMTNEQGLMSFEGEDGRVLVVNQRWLALGDRSDTQGWFNVHLENPVSTPQGEITNGECELATASLVYGATIGLAFSIGGFDYVVDEQRLNRLLNDIIKKSAANGGRLESAMHAIESAIMAANRNPETIAATSMAFFHAAYQEGFLGKLVWLGVEEGGWYFGSNYKNGQNRPFMQSNLLILSNIISTIFSENIGLPGHTSD